jgi:hypothetical protein
MVSKKKQQSQLLEMMYMLPELHCEITKSDCTKNRKVQGKALITKVTNQINKIAKDLGLEKIEFEDDGYSYCANDCIAKNIGFAKCDDDCNCHCHLK